MYFCPLCSFLQQHGTDVAAPLLSVGLVKSEFFTVLMLQLVHFKSQIFINYRKF